MGILSGANNWQNASNEKKLFQICMGFLKGEKRFYYGTNSLLFKPIWVSVNVA